MEIVTITDACFANEVGHRSQKTGRLTLRTSLDVGPTFRCGRCAGEPQRVRCEAREVHATLLRCIVYHIFQPLVLTDFTAQQEMGVHLISYSQTIQL